MSLLLNLLHGVKRTGKGQWIARCPSHEDRSPSLSVRCCDDGRWLVHCFAGCDTHDILGALSLEVADLFPEPLYHKAAPLQNRITAMDALKCLSREAGVIALIAADLAEGKPVDASRACKAAGLIAEALQEVSHG
jgi:hypothetical protein